MAGMIRNSDAKAILRKGQGREFKAGGAWIYDNEIDRVEGSFDNGDIVELHDFDGFFLGYGFINMNSKIRIRMMSRKKENPVSEALIERRVRDAWEHRKAVMADYVKEYLLTDKQKEFYHHVKTKYDTRKEWYQSICYTILEQRLDALRDEQEDKLVDDLHKTCGFRTDYEFITKSDMRTIEKNSKQR